MQIIFSSADFLAVLNLLFFVCKCYAHNVHVCPGLAQNVVIVTFHHLTVIYFIILPPFFHIYYCIQLNIISICSFYRTNKNIYLHSLFKIIYLKAKRKQKLPVTNRKLSKTKNNSFFLLLKYFFSFFFYFNGVYLWKNMYVYL